MTSAPSRALIHFCQLYSTILSKNAYESSSNCLETIEGYRKRCSGGRSSLAETRFPYLREESGSGKGKMNFTTHVMFGVLLAAVFFGEPRIILLVGIGSAIPDLDREYGFLSKESFRNLQVHRALFHNFLFLGLLYLINPFLALGAFLHTFLDALTTARDRGVEWLYPFSRLVKRAVYDSAGNRMELDPKQKLYFLQNEIQFLMKKTTKDLKPSGPLLPWRRTYGPALSGRVLDHGIYKFIDLTIRPIDLSFDLPFVIGAFGIILNFIGGEIDRKQLAKHFKPDPIYKALFYLSIGVMIFAVVLGGIMNPQDVVLTVTKIPYIAAGVAIVLLVTFVTLKFRYSIPVPSDDKSEPPI